jgi:transposase
MVALVYPVQPRNAKRYRVCKHPDSNLFGSLPGVGEKLGPRLLGEIGSDRSLYSDPKSLQCVAGTAPVSYQSGQIYRVYPLAGD